MKRFIVAFLSLTLLLCSCTPISLVQTGQTGGVLLSMDQLPPNKNSTGIHTLLVADAKVKSVSVDVNGHQTRVPVTKVKIDYNDPPMGECLGANIPVRFIGLESDRENPIPSGTTMLLSIEALNFVKTIRCEYVCSVPRFIWEELPLDFTPDMDIEITIEGFDFSEADFSSGGLVVIVNADIINNGGNDDEVEYEPTSQNGSN